MPEIQPKKQLTVSPVISEVIPPPQAANWFSTTRIGHEVQLLIGYIPTHRLVQLLQDTTIERGSTVSIPAQILHTISMGPRALIMLRAQVDEIFDAMERSGHLEGAGLAVEVPEGEEDGDE